MKFGTAGAHRGLLRKLEAIIVVVVGGALPIGGYGSVIGTALGALAFGVVKQGLPCAGVESLLNRPSLQSTNTRYINTIAMQDADVADSLLVTELFTPNGDWSSYPSHRHDEDDFPRITFLEETYYHRLDRPGAWGVQRVYTEDGSPDECMAVREATWCGCRAAAFPRHRLCLRVILPQRYGGTAPQLALRARPGVCVHPRKGHPGPSRPPVPMKGYSGST